MKLQESAANFNNFWNFKIQIGIFFHEKYQILTFDMISLRYEILDAQIKFQHFLRNYNFICETAVESSKFQISLQRWGGGGGGKGAGEQFTGRDSK